MISAGATVELGRLNDDDFTAIRQQYIQVAVQLISLREKYSNGTVYVCKQNTACTVEVFGACEIHECVVPLSHSYTDACGGGQ